MTPDACPDAVSHHVHACASAEWELWRKLVSRLVLLDAVTKADAESPATADTTPGQKLFALIREWGDARATLALAAAADQKEPRHAQKD